MVAVLGVAMSWALAQPIININTADADVLAHYLTGVGPKRAEAIVLYRKYHGPFKTLDDLTKVKGIGQKIIQANKNSLSVTDNISPIAGYSSPNKLR